jgi:putative redox protein
MSLKARSRSIPGTLRQEIVIDGKHRLITDEPEAVGGEGSVPSPHELLPAALAASVSTTLVMYARADTPRNTPEPPDPTLKRHVGT